MALLFKQSFDERLAGFESTEWAVTPLTVRPSEVGCKRQRKRLIPLDSRLELAGREGAARRISVVVAVRGSRMASGCRAEGIGGEAECESIENGAAGA